MPQRQIKCEDAIVGRLSGGDRRSKGVANQLAGELVRSPSMFAAAVRAMACSNPVVRMRAADALETASRSRPELLAAHRSKLLDYAAETKQQEVRWHLAQMLPRAGLSDDQRRRAFAVIEAYLDDESRIVRSEALTALDELAGEHRDLSDRAFALIVQALEADAPAVRARAKKLFTMRSKTMGPQQ